MRHAHRPALLGLLCAAALWLLVPGVASAHAHLVQADPAPDSIIAHTPTVASFLFDEPLNPALTRVRITDAAARPVTANTGHLGPDQGGTRWECCGAWVALFTTMENESMTRGSQEARGGAAPSLWHGARVMSEYERRCAIAERRAQEFLRDQFVVEYDSSGPSACAAHGRPLAPR